MSKKAATSENRFLCEAIELAHANVEKGGRSAR
jgi:hypothetical protein